MRVKPGVVNEDAVRQRLRSDVPIGALYGAMQGAVFYLALAMGTGALFRNFISGAVGAAFVLLANGFFTGFGSAQFRLSPFWNTSAPSLSRVEAGQLLSWTVQNRVGFVLVTAALLALAWVRAERRERLLG